MRLSLSALIVLDHRLNRSFSSLSLPGDSEKVSQCPLWLKPYCPIRRFLHTYRGAAVGRVLMSLVLRLAPVLVFCGLCCFAEELFAKPPNVVMIIADDQAYSDFGFMGNRQVQTPQLDKLAAQSARFVNGYVPSSVCRPSLVTLLTGLCPHQHGVHYNHPPPGFAKLTRSPDIDKQKFDELREWGTLFIRRVPTLPRVLAAQGYRCLQTGKYWEGHWRNAGFTEGMTTAQPKPNARYGNKTLANGDVVAHGNGDHGLSIGRETMQPIFDFIDDCGETPFFVWYAPFLPHLPHDSPAKFQKLYENNPDVPAHLRRYYAACTQFDATVGQLVDYIERRGLAGETLFVFVSDNGFVPDEKQPLREGEFNYTKRSKRSPFEDGLRTPILFRWDGQIKPATHEALCSSVDIAPTILQACGFVDADALLPGRSLLPAARGEEQLEPQPVFGEIYPGDASSLGNPSRDLAYRWVREGDYKLIVPHMHGRKRAWGGYVEESSLFNLAKDPHERRDLSEDAAMADELRRMQRTLNMWWDGR